MNSDFRRRIHVVAAALAGAGDTVLIATRPPGSHLAGGWEFPGGKLRPGEAPLVGLDRELAEELGVHLGAGPHRPIGKVSHSYAERDVLIEAWLVADYAGIPRSLEGQELRWCSKLKLTDVPLLPADAPLVDTLNLPAVIEHFSGAGYYIGSLGEQVPSGVRCTNVSDAMRAGDGGARFILLDQLLNDTQLRNLCDTSKVPVFAKGISLESAWRLGATGIHRL